ncbi:MAG: sigma-54-dependent Fis family transcriptional regulator [bacterium]|nr:sigma-54-dependent Fis family transcriptional regulator [bacterium]
MIESVKHKLWELLKGKNVSLAMIFNRDGEILWSKGRRIRERFIAEGHEFCKSLILKSMQDNNRVEQENVSISFSGDGLSESAERLRIKSVYIQPIEGEFFLYVDSGVRVNFSDGDREILNMLGSLLTEAVRKIKTNEDEGGGVSGQSEAIQKVRKLAIKFAVEEDCVLILGETGAGKSHIAELLHKYSGREGNFVVADTTTINENLFESVIFGHKKGSFTGAVDSRTGLIDEAANGTLFFDEIAEVPVSFQSKLLRFLETKKYRVLGEPVEKLANVRILTATNRDMKELIKEKLFRQDLYYRLNILSITLPPLRDRKDDIKAIVQEKREFLKGKEIGEGFWKTVLGYNWPGNFRELFAVLKRAGILCDSPITGDAITELFDGEGGNSDDGETQWDRVDAVWKEMEDGGCFWDVVKAPFMERELNRSEVIAIISRGLDKARGSYVDSLQYYNLERSDYKKFMKFIHNNKIKLDKT